MTKYKKLTIEVTQKHIGEGLPNDCDSCAISLAFRDALVKVYGNQCLVWTKTSMSDGEVELQYSIKDDLTLDISGEVDTRIGEYKSEDYKIR